MPKQKDLKRLIRGRMQKTGESYTAARSQILKKSSGSSRPAARGAATPSTNGGAARATAASARPTRTRQRTGSAASATSSRASAYATLAGMSDATIEAKTGCTWERWVGALDFAGAARMTHGEIAEYVHTKFAIPGWWAQAVTVGYERIRGLRAIGQRRDGSYEASKSKTVAAPVAAIFRALTHAPRRREWLPEPVRVRTSTADKSVRLAWEDGTPVEVYLVARGAAKTAVTVQHRKLPDKAAADRMKAHWAERLAALAALVAGD